MYRLQGLSNGVIEASSFRTSYVPLNKQEDFIKGMQARPAPAWLSCSCSNICLGPSNTPFEYNSISRAIELDFALAGCKQPMKLCFALFLLQAVREFLAKVKQDLGLDVYSFSIFHVFFEQYLTIGHDALVLLTFATLAVTAVVYAFTASLWASAQICIVLVMILVRMTAIYISLSIPGLMRKHTCDPYAFTCITALLEHLWPHTKHNCGSHAFGCTTAQVIRTKVSREWGDRWTCWE